MHGFSALTDQQCVKNGNIRVHDCHPSIRVGWSSKISINGPRVNTKNTIAECKFTWNTCQHANTVQWVDRKNVSWSAAQFSIRRNVSGFGRRWFFESIGVSLSQHPLVVSGHLCCSHGRQLSDRLATRAYTHAVDLFCLPGFIHLCARTMDKCRCKEMQLQFESGLCWCTGKCASN